MDEDEAPEDPDEPPADEGPGEPIQEEQATLPPSERVEELEALTTELQDRIEALEAERDELAEQVDHRTDQLARVQADFENYRKRAKREKLEAARDARIEVIEVLVEVLDNVDRAKDAAGADEGVLKGLDLVEQRIHAKLNDLGVETIAPERGATFDPEDHEAVLTEGTNEHAPDTVLELLVPGYKLEDRLIRAAKVKVATPADDDD